jgi:hypothetical protein
MKSTQTSTQSAERASSLLSETHRSAEHNTDTIPESEFLYDEVKQAKDPCRETSRVERVRENKPFGSVQLQTWTQWIKSGYPQNFGGLCPNYTFQQMEHYPNPYGQHDSVLQFQPPSCSGHALSLPTSSFDTYRHAEYQNSFCTYPRDTQHGIGQTHPSGIERGLLSQGTSIMCGSRDPQSVSSVGPFCNQTEPFVNTFLFPEKERDNPGLQRERNAPSVAEDRR